MNNRILIYLAFLVILSGCAQTYPYNYRIKLNKYEINILNQFMNKYNDLDNQLIIDRKFVYSNNMDLLIKLKNRLYRIYSYKNSFPFVPIIINYNQNYYYIIEYEKIINNNWFNDELIYNKYTNLVTIGNNIPEEMQNLSKEEFINNYLKRESNGKYTQKRIRRLFQDEDTIYDSILFLCQTKYNLLVKGHYGKEKYYEINIEKLY